MAWATSRRVRRESMASRSMYLCASGSVSRRYWISAHFARSTRRMSSIFCCRMLFCRCKPMMRRFAACASLTPQTKRPVQRFRHHEYACVLHAGRLPRRPSQPSPAAPRPPLCSRPQTRPAQWPNSSDSGVLMRMTCQSRRQNPAAPRRRKSRWICPPRPCPSALRTAYRGPFLRWIRSARARQRPHPLRLQNITFCNSKVKYYKTPKYASS